MKYKFMELLKKNNTTASLVLRNMIKQYIINDGKEEIYDK